MSTGAKIAAGIAAVGAAGLVGYGIGEFVEHEENQEKRIEELERENRELEAEQQSKFGGNKFSRR